MVRKARPAPHADLEAIALDLAACADSKKAERPLVLDLRGLSQVADFFIIAASISPIGVRAIAEAIVDRLRVHHNMKPLHVEGLDTQEWVCIDAADIVVHVFLDPLRKYYDLEGLWADAPRLAIPERMLRAFARR